MAVIISNTNFEIIKEQILDAYIKCANPVDDCALISDIRTEMKEENRWSGMTSMAIKIAPEGAKYVDDCIHIGDFEDLMLYLDYNVSFEGRKRLVNL